MTDEEAFESFQRQWRERNDPRPFLITGLEVSPDQQPPSTKAIIAAQAHDAQALARVQLPLANQAARERAAWGRCDRGASALYAPDDRADPIGGACRG